MSIIFIVAPILGYLAAGGIKFLLNSCKLRRLAFGSIGMGSFPSTHNSIVSTVYFTIGFGEGFSTPAASVSLALCLIVAIDSMDLRKKIERHAEILSEQFAKENVKASKLRLKLGHSLAEVLAGAFLGAILGYGLNQI